MSGAINSLFFLSFICISAHSLLPPAPRPPASSAEAFRLNSPPSSSFSSVCHFLSCDVFPSKLLTNLSSSLPVPFVSYVASEPLLLSFFHSLLRRESEPKLVTDANCVIYKWNTRFSDGHNRFQSQLGVILMFYTHIFNFLCKQMSMNIWVNICDIHLCLFTVECVCVHSFICHHPNFRIRLQRAKIIHHKLHQWFGKVLTSCLQSGRGHLSHQSPLSIFKC